MEMHGKEQTFQCLVCNQPFESKEALKEHMMVHEGENPYSCTMCSKTFRKKGYLKMHITVHENEEKPKDPKPPTTERAFL